MSKLSVGYTKSTSTTDPQMSVSIYVSASTHLKYFLLALIGKPQFIEHSLTDNDIEGLSQTIARWRLVKKLRSYKLPGR